MRVLPATVPVLEGVASDIPFPDNFFDAITVAQVGGGSHAHARTSALEAKLCLCMTGIPLV